MEKMQKNHAAFRIATAICLAITAVLLVAVHSLYGWLLALIVLALSFKQEPVYRRQVVLILISICILALLPVRADGEPIHILINFISLVLAVLVPFVVLRYIYNDKTVVFQFHPTRRWYSYEVAYVFAPFILGYLSLPYYFSRTKQYEHWAIIYHHPQLELTLLSLIAVGIWDELFFVATILGILQKQMSFWIANTITAVIFSSFLYALGFGSWGVFVCFIFASIQGYIYKRTGLLLYAAAVHIVFDVMLFLALVHAHFPDHLTIFILQ